MPKVGPVELLWKGGSVCMTRGIGLKSIPKSNDGMSESSGNDYSVGGGMSDSGHGCEVGGGMLVLEDRYGVGGRGIKGRDNLRGYNRKTRAMSDRSCAHT